MATGDSRLVYHDQIDSALREGAHWCPARLAWQISPAGGAPLALRRLLVAPRGIKRAKEGGHGGPMRSVRGRTAHDTQMIAAGTIFGATLGNLMHHARGKMHKLMHAMRALRRALAPAGRALSTATGDDRRILARGLACHRLLQAQGRRMRELKRAPPIDHKMGHVGVVLGATAAILVAFECMTLDDADAEGLGDHLAACLRDAHSALASWRLADTMDSDMLDARSVEIRALERARAGVARAQETGSGLGPVAAMRLQLDCYRRAAWPSEGPLDDEGHADLLERIASGELVDEERDELTTGAAAPNIISLAALPSLDEAAASGSSCSSDAPRHLAFSDSSGSSARSSAWSFSSADSVSASSSAPSMPDMESLMRKLNAAPLLLSAAREAVTPPLIILHNGDG